WTGQTLDKAAPEWIGDDHKHNRNRAGPPQQRCCDRGSHCEDHVRCHSYQFMRVRLHAIGIGGGKTCVKPDVASLSPSQLKQPLLEHCYAGLDHWVVFSESDEHADPPHPIWLLRLRCERPRSRCTAKQRDEIAPFHSITSSARASSVGGRVRPSTLAVVKLMTRTN